MDGMFDQLLRPILKKVHPASIEEVRSNVQKELRIIDTMEPLLNQHRLVFDKTLIKNDIERALTDSTKLPYSLMYQLTHISRQRGALRHDDRLDALSIGLQQLVETVGVDEDEMMQDYKDEQIQNTLDKWVGDIVDGHWWR